MSNWESWIENNIKEEKESVQNPWEALMDRQNISRKPSEPTSYDNLCDLAIATYELDKKNRKDDLKDRVHYFLLWWNENNKYMNKYCSKSAIAKVLKIGHSNIIHYVGTKYEEGKRKKSGDFEANTKCIADFLN